MARTAMQSVEALLEVQARLAGMTVETARVGRGLVDVVRQARNKVRAKFGG